MSGDITNHGPAVAQPGEAAPLARVVSGWPGVERIRASFNRHPVRTDAALAMLLFLVLSYKTGGKFHGPFVLLLAVHGLLIVPLIWRRHYPRAVFGLVTGVAAVVASGQPIAKGIPAADFAVLIALYTVAAHCTRRQAVIAVAILEAGVVFVAFSLSQDYDALNILIFFTAMVTAAFVLGVNVQTRRAYLASLVDRADRAERERDQQSQIAAARERAVIAREMHDIVAHNLSVMIALADGAAFAARANAAEAEAAARHVSATGRQALDEMHRLLGVLRGNGEASPRAPQPGIGQLDELVTQVRTAGLATSWTVTGRPFPVPPAAGLTVYRVAQEALTNVLKHADEPTETRMTLHYRDPIVELEILDNGHGSPESSAAATRHGLNGMRERVAAFGGQVEAGTRATGGWRIWARLDTGRLAADGAS